MFEGTQTGLLAVKMQRPRLPLRLVARERLFARLASAHVSTLTVIKAAAGFGKTSLALAWADRLSQTRQRVAWLSLAPEDNEPGQFLRYVVQALYLACPEIDRQGLDLIAEISLIRPLDVIHVVLNALSSIETDIFLFLDDYHHLKDAAITDCMAYLLLHAPPHLHVILTTRLEPGLPLVRLRAIGQLVEIDAASLRFDLEETRQFLEQEGEEGTNEAAALQEKTEGWPVMIRIITATSQQSGLDLASYIRRLSISHRPIHSHLVEMLNGLPEEVVGFLLKVSPLENLCKQLCQAVTGMAHAGEIFEQLTSRQLLLAPLDAEGSWFRCHPLLRGFLQDRLQKESPALIEELNRRAYGWYAHAQRWTDAIRHALEVGDTELAVKWVETCAIALLRRGELLTLFAWERIFPPTLMKRQTKARLAIAWGMALAVRFDEALALAMQIEADSSVADPLRKGGICCECQTVRAVALALADETEAALALAEASLESRASGPWTTNAAANVVLMGWWKQGELERCYHLPWLSFPGDDGGQNVVATMYRLCLLGLIEYTQLHQTTSWRHFKEALRVARNYAGPYSAAAAQPAVLMAQFLYDQGQLEEAEALLLGRLPVINAACMLECVVAAYTILIRVAVRRGRHAQAEDLLTQAGELAHSRRWSRLEAHMLYERVRIALAQGQVSASSSYVARLHYLLDRVGDKSGVLQDEIKNLLDISEALLHMSKRNWPDALNSLQKRQDRAVKRRNQTVMLECTVMQAIITMAAPDMQGPAHLHEALSMLLLCGRLQICLDALYFVEESVIRRVWQTVTSFGHEAAGELARRIEVALLAHRSDGALAEPESALLSPREQMILHCLLEGKSNKEIARALDVTPETVKTHLKRLFQKMNVSSRSQAVSRYYGHRL